MRVADRWQDYQIIDTSGENAVSIPPPTVAPTYG